MEHGLQVFFGHTTRELNLTYADPDGPTPPHASQRSRFREGEAMVVEVEGLHPMGYGFVVYHPPVPGLPWLAVCLGPNGRVLGAETFDTEEAAQCRVTELADSFKIARMGRRPSIDLYAIVQGCIGRMAPS